MSKTITTPAGKALWVKAFEPDEKYHVYSVKLILPQKDAQELIDQVDGWAEESFKEAVKEKKTKKRATLPYQPVLDDEGNETGDIQFTFKQKSQTAEGKKLNVKIGVFDGKGKPITNPVQIGNGSLVKVAFEPNQWANGAQGAGVQLRFRALQILKLVEYGGGTTADAFGFGEENDGYEFKESKASNEANEDEESFDAEEAENADF